MRAERSSSRSRRSIVFPVTRRTIRLRLTLTYGVLLVVSGAVLLALTYVLVANLQAPVEHHIPARPADGPLPPLPDLRAGAAQRDADLRNLLTQSAIALAVMAVVSLALGCWITGRMLRPLRTITARTRRISAGNLDQRIALGGPFDELTELGETIDGLLARLERAFAAQHQFVANASHELRTPMTLQRAHLEAALTDPVPTHEVWRAACERALAAGADQERMLDALLTLARSTAGLDRLQALDLALITGDVLHTSRAARRDITVTATLDPAPMSGDPRLIEHLVTNLIDNAFRHNINDGRVEVRTTTSVGQSILWVSNTGPDIPPAEVGRLFRPFQRLGPDRTGQRTSHRTGPDSGLGLSIVDSVATAHSAHIDAEPRPGGGLEVTVTFPPFLVRELASAVPGE